MVLLEIKDIDISYGKQLTVQDGTITLDKGQICSIVGESGSGKTTVIRAVLGLLVSTSWWPLRKPAPTGLSLQEEASKKILKIMLDNTPWGIYNSSLKTKYK